MRSVWRPICPYLVCLCLAFPLGGCLAHDGSVQPLPAEEDVLKAGDALHINVAGEEDLSGGFAVKDDGTVRMELLGAVPAAGLSVEGFAEQLRRLLAAGYLRNPQVRVERMASFVPPAPVVASAPPPVLRPSQ
jgi:protein involved in polysaccharide export with SLBB domain